MSIAQASLVTITAPAGVDGYSGQVTLNDKNQPNCAGYIYKATGFGGAAVRTSMDSRVEAHGAVFGNFYYAHRPFTLEVFLKRANNWGASDAHFTGLCAAFDAMKADGTIVFTDTDGIQKRILFRQEQPPTDPDEQGHTILSGVCQDPRIYSNALITPGPSVTNAGNAGSPPAFTFTPSGNGTVILMNTTAGLGNPAVTLTVGPNAIQAGGGQVTVDFKDRSIVQGGVQIPSAEVWPDSLWWELVPVGLGTVNTWTRTGTATLSTPAAIVARSAWKAA